MSNIGVRAKKRGNECIIQRLPKGNRRWIYSRSYKRLTIRSILRELTVLAVKIRNTNWRTDCFPAFEAINRRLLPLKCTLIYTYIRGRRKRRNVMPVSGNIVVTGLYSKWVFFLLFYFKLWTKTKWNVIISFALKEISVFVIRIAFRSVSRNICAIVSL